MAKLSLILRVSVINIIIIFALLITASSEWKKICYIKVEDNSTVDESIGRLCTHIIAGFATVSDGRITEFSDEDANSYRNVINLKKTYPSLKVMLSVGGGGNDSEFHDVCRDPLNIDIFTISVLNVMLDYGFDGLDIDWEFPAWNTDHPEDKQTFPLLLQELKKQFWRQNNRSINRKELLLSVAVSAIINIVKDAYNITEIAKHIDFVNLMSYDFHRYSKYWPFAGFNAPLYGRTVEKTYFTYLNTNFAANYWIASGVSKDKLMIGIPTYGVSFKLADRNCVAPDCAIMDYSADLTFTYICELLSNSSTHRVFNNESKVPYLYNDDQLWISYDDSESVAIKAQYIKEHNFGGSMTFSLNSDDSTYKCSNNTKFVLQSIIYSILSD